MPFSSTVGKLGGIGLGILGALFGFFSLSDVSSAVPSRFFLVFPSLFLGAALFLVVFRVVFPTDPAGDEELRIVGGAVFGLAGAGLNAWIELRYFSISHVM